MIEQQPSDKGLNVCEALKFIGIDSPGAMQQYWKSAFTLHKLKENTDLKLAALIEPLAVASRCEVKWFDIRRNSSCY